MHHYPPTKVLWTSYEKSLGIYQGALEFTEAYSKEFLKQTSAVDQRWV